MPVHIDRLKTLLRDRYSIERELGSGGMATVYLAEDLRHHRKVAVKVLRPEIAASLGSERFFREIEVAARLQHPHILPLLDSGEGEGLYWFVMPYVAGESLRERLAREGELPVHDAVKILSEVVDALAAAHADGVVHRDIKPDNVMLSGRHALVTDFGVAKAVSEATGRQSLTTAGVALGTPSYMAPEQATADPQLDHRVDIYAAGVLGYEMLTGSPPFTGRSAQEILAAQVTQAPVAITARREAVPPALEAVLMKCLEKRPADRWQHAEELLAQLEVLATPSGGMTPVQTRPVRAVAAPPRQFPRWAAWLTGGALVAGSALAFSLRQSPPDLLVLGRRTVVAAEPAFESWPSLSPDGQVIAYDRADMTSQETVVQQVNGGAPTEVTAGVPGGNGLSAISPDGSRILFVGREGIYLMPTLGGQARVVAAGMFPAWSPDGARFAYANVNLDTIYQQRVDQPGHTAVAGGHMLHSPAWSGDGDWIAYVEGNVFFHTVGNTAPSTIKLVGAGGGTPVALTDSLSLNTSPAWIPGRRSLLFISNREGGRDIYQLDLKRSGKPQRPATRITTGLNPERLTLSANGRRLAWSVLTQTSNVWSVAIPGRDSVPLSRARQVTSGTQNIENAGVSTDGWLYYDSDRSGNFDIWRIPLAGGQPQQVTTDLTDDFAPDPSPDGRLVAFHSTRNGVNNRDIFVMPVAGGPAVQVSTSPGDDRGPNWSPDGRFLSWGDNYSDSGVLVAERQAGGSWSAPRRYLGKGGDSWAADGRFAIFDSLGMHLVDPVSGVRSLLLSPRATGGRGLSYSVISTDLRTVYAPRVDSTGRFIIVAFPAGGTTPRTLVYADNPLSQQHRYGLALAGGRFYVPVLEARMDVWVAEVDN